MISIAIRELSAGVIEKAAERNEPLAITNDRAVCGVLIPVSPGWVEEVVNNNLSQIVRSVNVGEGELASGHPLVTLDDALGQRPEGRPSARLRRVPIRRVSGKLIREAAERGEPFAITSDHQLRGVLIPVSQQWLEAVVDSNLSRIVRSVQVGEAEIASGRPFVTLDAATSENATAPPQAASNGRRRAPAAVSSPPRQR